MQSNFARVLSVVLAHEGGYVDHPRDPGGATNMGITLATLARWRGKPVSKAEVKALTRAEAGDIYRARYWLPVRGDVLPTGIDLTTMDYGVNSGPARSVKALQKALGVAQDGLVGARTMSAAQNADRAKTIKAHCAARLGFVRSLAIWSTFGKGWSRRIADVEATALSWVLAPADLEAEAKAAKDKAVAQGGGAVVAGGGGLALPDLSGLPWWLIAGAAVLVIAPLIIRTIVNAQRAQALAKVAKETV